MEYKKWSLLTKAEKAFRKWVEKGRPHLVWDSDKRGTYYSNDEEHARIMEENCKPFRAKDGEMPKMQSHKRKLLGLN